MKKILIASSILALSLLAVPASAQSRYGRYDAPITGAQMTDFPSSRANTTLTGSFLSIGPRYDDREEYYRDRDYARDRDYDRDRDNRDRHDDRH